MLHAPVLICDTKHRSKSSQNKLFGQHNHSMSFFLLNLVLNQSYYQTRIAD